MKFVAGGLRRAQAQLRWHLDRAHPNASRGVLRSSMGAVAIMVAVALLTEMATHRSWLLWMSAGLVAVFHLLLIWIQCRMGRLGMSEALFHASQANDVDTLRTLARFCGRESVFKTVGPLSHQALHQAVLKDALQAARWLLEESARVKQTPSEPASGIENALIAGHPPLFFASSAAMVHLLVEWGARLDVRMDDNMSSTLLHGAVLKGLGHWPVIRALLQLGAPRTATNAQGFTPIEVASRLGHHDLVQTWEAFEDAECAHRAMESVTRLPPGVRPL